MADSSNTSNTDDPNVLREEVEEELDDLIDEAAEEERNRMAKRDEEGVDEPSDPIQ